MHDPDVHLTRDLDGPLMGATKRLRLVGLATVLAAGGALLVSGAQPSTADAAAQACGANNPGNTVRATIELGRTRDFWQRFPNETRRAPELDRDTPATVIVFDGPTTIAVVTGVTNGQTSVGSVRVNNVVCVFLPPSELYPYGEPLVYSGVNLEGFTP